MAVRKIISGRDTRVQGTWRPPNYAVSFPAARGDAVHVPKYTKIAHRQLHRDSCAANTTTLPVPLTKGPSHPHALNTFAHSCVVQIPVLKPSSRLAVFVVHPPVTPLSLPSTSFPSHYSQITLSGSAIYRVTILSHNCHHCCTRLRVTAGSTALPL